MRQPADEWGFLPDDGSLGRTVLPAEVSALHLERPRTPAQDPGTSEVELAEVGGDDRLVVAFADEEPEVSGRRAVPEESEPDLEDMLESQHYAFGPDMS